MLQFGIITVALHPPGKSGHSLHPSEVLFSFTTPFILETLLFETPLCAYLSEEKKLI